MGIPLVERDKDIGETNGRDRGEGSDYEDALDV